MAGEAELLGKIDGKISDFKSEMQQQISDFKAGAITQEKFDEGFNSLLEKMKEHDSEKYKEFQEKLNEFKQVAKEQGEELTKLKNGSGSGVQKLNPFKTALKEKLESEEFKNYVDGGAKGKLSFDLKQVSITDDYTGTSRTHITFRDPNVIDHPKVERLNIRDLMMVSPIDMPFLAFIEVYDWDRAANVVTENGVLQESAFKLREATVDAKRLGTHVDISKRMLKANQFLMNHLMTRLPAQVKYHEDFQLLFGDGTGNNLQGLFDDGQDFTTVVNTTITGAAASVSSVASYNSGAGAIITFATPQNQLQNGDTITIANATASVYNGSHTVIVLDPQRVLITVTYAAEADTSAWTWTSANAFKDSIDNAQELDVIKVAKTLITQQEYMPTGIVLNPVDVTKMELLKGSDEHYLSVERMENGIMMIGGVPVVETTAMPAGRFLVGDFMMGAALAEFTGLTLEFSESTQEKLKNTVEAIIYEEILFPIYNKFMFVTGTFSTAITAISV